MVQRLLQYCISMNGVGGHFLDAVSVVKVQRTQSVECLDGAVEIPRVLAVDSLDAYPEDLE